VGGRATPEGVASLRLRWRGQTVRPRRPRARPGFANLVPWPGSSGSRVASCEGGISRPGRVGAVCDRRSSLGAHDVVWSVGFVVGSPAPRRIIPDVNEEVARWYAERDAELELQPDLDIAYQEGYDHGYDEGLRAAREQQGPERDPDFLYFGPDGRLIESQASESA
jgi:hypothetical protein